jgi:hypothetical protein
VSRNNQIINVMKMQRREAFMWFYLPWAILLGNLAISLIASLLFNPEEVSINGGFSSIFIYMLIIGMITLGQTFNFTLGLSVSRKDYFTGTVLSVLAVCAIHSIVIVFMTVLEQWSSQWDGLAHFFTASSIHDGSIPAQLLFYITVFLNLYFTGFTLASLKRRFGGLTLTIVVAVLFILLTATSIWGGAEEWRDISEFLTSQSAIELAPWSIPLTAVYIGLSYLFLRKATV